MTNIPAALINHRFGLLTVVERVADRWRCICDCGATKIALTGHLRCGSVVKCSGQCPAKYAKFIGARFGRLVVLSIDSKSEKRYAKCRCDCGSIKAVQLTLLKSGNTKSCGCLARETRFDGRNRNPNRTKSIPEYGVWSGMKSRCNNPSHVHFANYGGRGIKVCDKWSNSFEAFLNDMGRRPSPHHSIERIDNALNYSLGNCRWADASEQARNRRDNRLLTWKGHTLTITDWAIRVGIRPGTLFERLRAGWGVEKALSTPVRLRALRVIG